MLLGLSLFYVGAVLILNGLWMLGRIGDREIPVINLFTGGLSLLVSLKLAFGDGADAASVKAAAFSLLFALTYLWVAYNRLREADGRGLGWFSLFVAITAVPVAIDTLRLAGSTWELWLGLSWAWKAWTLWRKPPGAVRPTDPGERPSKAAATGEGAKPAIIDNSRP